MYSGGIPIFEEGDIFRTRIPLSEVITQTMGPTIHDKLESVLEFCKAPKRREEGKLRMTFPEKPKSKYQKVYKEIINKKGKVTFPFFEENLK